MHIPTEAAIFPHSFRGCDEQGKMDNLLANSAAALLYCAELCQATMGEVLHVHLYSVHTLDCYLFILHGVDGEWGRLMLLYDGQLIRRDLCITISI